MKIKEFIELFIMYFLLASLLFLLAVSELLSIPIKTFLSYDERCVDGKEI